MLVLKRCRMVRENLCVHGKCNGIPTRKRDVDGRTTIYALIVNVPAVKSGGGDGDCICGGGDWMR